VAVTAAARRRATLVVAGLLAAAVALVVVELSQGALSFGAGNVPAPCTPRPAALPRSNADRALQQVVLDGLDGAACTLGTTREELVLSLAPETGIPRRRWDEATVERAVRAGLLAAVERAHARGRIGRVTADLLRRAARRVPVGTLVRGGGAIAALVGRP
jgi:hypothetical protein